MSVGHRNILQARGPLHCKVPKSQKCEAVSVRTTAQAHGVVNTQQLNCTCVSWSQGENKPGTSSACSASSTTTACFSFFPPSSTSYSQPFLSSWLLLSYLRLPAGAEPLVHLYSHLSSSLTDAGFLSTWLQQTHLCSGWGDVWLALRECY